MFGRKRQQWFMKAQTATEPIDLREIAPKDILEDVASYLRMKIGSEELNGFVSFDDEKFIPTIYLQQLLSRELAEKGFIDICSIIDTTNLPGELLEAQIKVNVQDIDGFFDVIHRKFFSIQGARNEIKQTLGATTVLDLKFLLNKLFWTEEHLEGILDLLAQNNQFVGYIDPIKQRIYNFTPLIFSSPSDFQRNIKYLKRFINTSFQMESQVSLKHISKLTRQSEEKCLEFLEKNRDNINFIFSTNFDYLYPSMDIINQILKDIFVYRDIPIKFWLQRLDVDRGDLLKIIKILNQSLKGTLSSEEFIAPSLEEWFENGIDIENLATALNLDPLNLLNQIYKLAKLLGLSIIAGESSDPFLVKGVKQFEIFCQVDTSSYSNPHLYFECQNCRRIMCSNCRSAGSKHECPFCRNISAFIIDLPRHCLYCHVNYTHSYNLIDTEECYFCKRGPLKTGWIEFVPDSSEASKITPVLSKFLKQTVEPDIPLQKIISLLKGSDSETISLLESYILHGTIQGRISIQDMSLQLTTQEEKFTCGICELSFDESMRYSCSSCNTKVCMGCFKEMSSVGMIFCPECGENLEKEIQ
ncbi:MAG: hypothetical protein ACFFB2_05170 [Promethearchaeota archaeon]